ncbi:unnamed protein product [Ceratitis capitata]|uniref:(Mediterranean fruit fly) hypothetical protein n=1 Tax=Ceratitis capitata TaxID=7213 RepID=A0A811UIV3_CERCA|nr:unnamed protein product [Ceratitis capitata]
MGKGATRITDLSWLANFSYNQEKRSGFVLKFKKGKNFGSKNKEEKIQMELNTSAEVRRRVKVRRLNSTEPK